MLKTVHYSFVHAYIILAVEKYQFTYKVFSESSTE